MVTFYDQFLPEMGKVQAKSSLSTTMIVQLGNKIIGFMPKIVGRFGFREEKEVRPTFGMNQKGGMDDFEFEKFIFN